MKLKFKTKHIPLTNKGVEAKNRLTKEDTWGHTCLNTHPRICGSVIC